VILIEKQIGDPMAKRSSLLSQKAKATKRVSKAQQLFAVQKGYGFAPEWDDIKLDSPNYDDVYQFSLNWCNAIFDNKDLKIEFLVWAKENEIDVGNMDSLADYHFNTIGKIAWIHNSGGPLTDTTLDWLDAKVLELKIKADIPQPIEIEIPKQIKKIRNDSQIGSIISETLKDSIFEQAEIDYSTLNQKQAIMNNVLDWNR